MKNKLLLVFLFCSSVVFGQIAVEDYPVYDKNVAEKVGSTLDVSLMVVGPDNPTYSVWGHIAILINDISYDYGKFNMHDKDFTKKFLRGQMDYLCDASSAKNEIYYYKYSKRDVFLLDLNLTNEEKYVIYSYLKENVKPENNIYEYMFFENNCSTMIRDILDMATKGQIYSDFQDKTDYSIREHAFRFTSQIFFSEWALQFMLGSTIDNIATKWETMYLPNDLKDYLSDYSYINSNNQKSYLVKSIKQVNYGLDKPFIQSKPSSAWLLSLLLGIALGSLGGALVLLSSLKKGFRIVSGMFMTVIGALTTLLGFLSLYLQLFTEFFCAYESLNYIYYSPLGIVLIIIGVLFACGSKNSRVAAISYYGLFAVVSIIMLGLKMTGIINQAIYVPLLTILPVYLFMLIGLIFAIERKKI